MKALVLLFLLIPVISLGQDILIDFEESNLDGWFPSKEGRWCISDAETPGVNHTLKHCFDNEVAGSDYISFVHNPLELSNCETIWQFELRYEFLPSANNHWAIFLTNNSMPSSESRLSDGWVIGVNYQGNTDEIIIWRVEGGKLKELINTGFNWQEKITSDQNVGLRFEKTPFHEFSLSIRPGEGDWVVIGRLLIPDLIRVNAFTLFYKYSASHDQGIYLDNLHISGKFVLDILPPVCSGMYVLSDSKLEMQFSEPVCTEINEYCVPEVGCGTSSSRFSKDIVIDLPNNLNPGNDYTLKLPPLRDIYGNFITAEDRIEEFYYPSAYDLIISEIMADPTPSVLLPEAEYIELINRSGKKLQIKNWSLSVNGRICKLPVISLSEGEMLFMAESSKIDLFSAGSKSLGIDQFPTLNNQEASVMIRDASGRLIHAIEYLLTWHAEPMKRGGGWSLEMRDIHKPCSGSDNWCSSEDYRGGTPGEENSAKEFLYSDTDPELWRAAITEEGTLMLYFSEPMDSLSLSSAEFYIVNEDIGKPFNISPSFPLANQVELAFEIPFSEGVDYEIRLTSDICDCSGKGLAMAASKTFRVSREADSADILINEILFDPEISHIEFIELYNNSMHTVDLKNFRLAVTDAKDTSGLISREYWPLNAGDYAIIASDYSGIDNVGKFDRSEKVVYMSDMPRLPNNGTSLYLFINQNKCSDIVNYYPDQHHRILAETKGVSLERVSMRLGADADLWHSASSDAGYMTPAAKNSQAGIPGGNCSVNLGTEIFTPNGDGIDETLKIGYVLDTVGYMVQIIVFDLKGRRRRILADGLLLGTEGEFEFDGKEENGELLTNGYYIMYFNAYHENGRKIIKKMSFVLAR